MHAHRRRTLLLTKPRAAAATGPATEVIRIGSTTLVVGTTVGAGNAVAALNDSSDSSYLDDVAVSDRSGTFRDVQVRGALTDLTLDAGRNIASATITLRALCSNTGQLFNFAASFAGITTSPGDWNPSIGSSFSNVTSPPFTKSGGGAWTPANINGASIIIDFASNPATSPDIKLADVLVTVTYA